MEKNISNLLRLGLLMSFIASTCMLSSCQSLHDVAPIDTTGQGQIHTYQTREEIQRDAENLGDQAHRDAEHPSNETVVNDESETVPGNQQTREHTQSDAENLGNQANEDAEQASHETDVVDEVGTSNDDQSDGIAFQDKLSHDRNTVIDQFEQFEQYKKK